MQKKIKLLVIFVLIISLSSCKKEDTKINIYSLKGATSISLVELMNKNDSRFVFHVVTNVDEITSAIASNKADIALLPSNVASILYNKDLKIKVVSINTLGVLYLVSNDPSIKSFKDLNNKTIYLTGKGTTPEYIVNYLLLKNNINANLEFKSESTEIITSLINDHTSLAILPEPFVTNSLEANDKLMINFSLDELFNELNGSHIVTAVTVASDDLINNNYEIFKEFMSLYQESVNYVNDYDNIANTSKWVVEMGIVKSEEIVKKALKNCNIVYIDGNNMIDILNNYLKILYDQNPKSIGDKLPDKNFYYEEK